MGGLLGNGDFDYKTNGNDIRKRLDLALPDKDLL